MIKTKLTVGDTVALHQELNALLSEKISFKTKYGINKLILSTTQIGENFDKIRTELLEKYGTPEEDKYIFKTKEKGEKFNNEFSSVLENVEELTHPEFKIEDFDFISTVNYRVIYKLISEDVAEEVEVLND